MSYIGHKYRELRGYAPVHTTDVDMEQWRTGGAAANPAEAQALVREIDRLREKLSGAKTEADSAWAACHESNKTA